MKKYEKLIRYLVWKMWERNKWIDYRDLIQEAWLVFFSIKQSYNSEKSSFTTYLYRCVKNHLFNYIQKEKRTIKTIPDFCKEQKLFNLQLFLSMLSEEAKLVVDILLDPASTLYTRFKYTKYTNESPQMIKRELKAILKHNYHYSEQKIDKCFQEIKKALTVL